MARCLRWVDAQPEQEGCGGGAGGARPWQPALPSRLQSPASGRIASEGRPASTQMARGRGAGLCYNVQGRRSVLTRPWIPWDPTRDRLLPHTQVRSWWGVGLGEFPASAPQALSIAATSALPPQPGWVTISRARIFFIQHGEGSSAAVGSLDNLGGGVGSDRGKDTKAGKKGSPWSLS